jgi:hypothetical protein
MIDQSILKNGIPRSPPDLTYSGVGWPIAVDASGNLYAADKTPATVFVFPPGSLTPIRQINLPSGSSFFGRAYALAVGHAGYLYVAYFGFFSSLGTGGVLVYGPHQSGNAKPLQNIITTGGYWGASNGVAIDAAGDLLNGETEGYPSGSVDTYSTPVKNPTKVRTLSVLALGIVVDSHQELYVNTWLSNSVSAYPVTASSPNPDRVISVKGPVGYFGNGIATSAGQLFIPDFKRGLVYELFSTVNGPQTPISTLAVPPAPEDVKVGP